SICYDMRFDDIYEDIGASMDAVVVAANWPAAREDDWRQIIRDRATELNSYMIGVNCYGEQEEHYSGYSCVIGPDGEALFEIEDMEDMVIVDIEKVE
ncbi:MAG: carbon-nitrogen family hydrolase, partial [Eubacterium sp.]|nr:carbon-nitrogen family hydrolase [Eubacterium sp.]